MQHLFAGSQLAITVALFTAIGYWIDQRAGWSPWGLIGGALIGIFLGLLSFLEIYAQGNRKSR